MKCALAALPLSILLLAGCATVPETRGRADLLDFLVDGQTTRAEVLLKLGQPSAKFETEKILTYRVAFDPKKKAYYVVERQEQSSAWSTWERVKWSLVLVFDEQGVLQKHSRVEVN